MLKKILVAAGLGLAFTATAVAQTPRAQQTGQLHVQRPTCPSLVDHRRRPLQPTRRGQLPRSRRSFAVSPVLLLGRGDTRGTFE